MPWLKMSAQRIYVCINGKDVEDAEKLSIPYGNDFQDIL